MAGEANTTQFMLSNATLMLGPQAEMFDLLPAVHSLGLVKNIKVKSAPEFKELTQGVLNKIVYSVKVGSTTSVMAEIYEFTRRNIAYALGLNGGVNAVTAPIATSLGVASTASAMTLTVSSGTGILANMWILIADPILTDKTYLRQVASVATNVLTLTAALPAVVLAIGTTVSVVGTSDVGAPSVGQQFFSCKIIGTTAEGQPSGFVFPKVRVVNGLDFGFTTDDFGNIPLELQIYDLVPTDPHYVLMAGRQGLFLAN